MHKSKDQALPAVREEVPGLLTLNKFRSRRERGRVTQPVPLPRDLAILTYLAGLRRGLARVLGNQFFLDLKRSPAAVKVCVHDEQFCASSGTDGRRSRENNCLDPTNIHKNKIAVDERSSVARSSTLPFPTLFAGRAVTHRQSLFIAAL